LNVTVLLKRYFFEMTLFIDLKIEMKQICIYRIWCESTESRCGLLCLYQKHDCRISVLCISDLNSFLNRSTPASKRVKIYTFVIKSQIL